MSRHKKALLFTALILLTTFPLAGLPLVRNDGPQRADAIIVIGGDHKPQRIKRAVELYQNGYAPIVLLSAGTEVAEGVEQVAEAEVMRRQALAYVSGFATSLGKITFR